jgi:hypothetical protein
VGAPSFDEFGSEEGRVCQSAGGQFGEFHIRLLWSSRRASSWASAVHVRSSPPVLAIGGANFVDVYPISQFLDGHGGAANPLVVEFEADFTIYETLVPLSL